MKSFFISASAALGSGTARARPARPLLLWKPGACAHTRYLPAGSGGKTYTPAASVYTLVAMVEPSSLADTVTPSSFWLERDAIAPESSGSAACAAVAASRDVAHARSEASTLLLGILLEQFSDKR